MSNHLEFDVNVPLSEQLDDLDEDLLWIKFSDDCGIDVSWLPAHEPLGKFVTVLCIKQSGVEWDRHRDRYQERAAGTVESLRRDILDLTEIARLHLRTQERPPVRVPPGVVDPAEVSPGIITSNRLPVDPDVPLEHQLDELGEGLLWIEFGDRCALGVSWLPAYDETGRFVMRLLVGPRRLDWDDAQACVQERRSHDLAMLRRDVLDLVSLAKGVVSFKQSEIRNDDA
jgi:hypothetical protein